jgi:hypothetical protein
MEQRKFNPFESQNEDLEIQNEDELKEAKNMAGVVNSQEHLERLLTSGDKKLIQAGLEQLNKRLQEKDATINSLRQQISVLEKDKAQLGNVREALNTEGGEKRARIIFGANPREIYEEEMNKINDMSKEEFENRYGTNVVSVGLDPRYVLENAYNSEAAWISDPLKYLREISEALQDKDKEVIVVENSTYIVDKK